MQRCKLKSPGSRHGGARTGSAGEETATLQVVVVEEMMCAKCRAEQGEIGKTLVCRISLEAKFFSFLE